MRAHAQVWDPDALADTSTAHLQHRHKLTPYRDAQLHGRVHATFVRGHQVGDTIKTAMVLSKQPLVGFSLQSLCYILEAPRWRCACNDYWCRV